VDVDRRLPTSPGAEVDLYDKNEFVTPAVAKLTEFYRTNLADAADKLAFAG
jgi:hypothetical protein